MKFGDFLAQVGCRVEGKESGFLSLESIWTEDGGSGGHRRGSTGWAEPTEKREWRAIGFL